MSKNEQQLNGQINDQIDSQSSKNISIQKQEREDTQEQNSENIQKLNTESSQETRQLKDRFLEAVVKDELGSVENSGTVGPLKEFKVYFSDIKTDYINSFLPAATIEPGQCSASHTKYLFRVRKVAYLVHPDVLLVYQD